MAGNDTDDPHLHRFKKMPKPLRVIYARPRTFLSIAVGVLAFLLMPFSVFGVKARIESLEAQIDSLHEDLRMISMRASGALPPSATKFDQYDDVPNFGRLKNSQRAYAEPVAEHVPPSTF